MIWPILEARAGTLKYFRSVFGSNENFEICFWDQLTFIIETRKFQIVKGPFWNNIHSYFYSYKSPRSWCKCCNYYWQQWCKWRIVCFNDWRYHRKTCWYTDCLSLRKKWVRYLILFLHKFLFDCRLFGLIRGNFFLLSNRQNNLIF